MLQLQFTFELFTRLLAYLVLTCLALPCRCVVPHLTSLLQPGLSLLGHSYQLMACLWLYEAALFCCSGWKVILHLGIHLHTIAAPHVSSTQQQYWLWSCYQPVQSFAPVQQQNVLNKFFKHNFTPHLLFRSSEELLLLGVVFVVGVVVVASSPSSKQASKQRKTRLLIIM